MNIIQCCQHCGVPSDSLLQCNRCKQVKYCGAACQKAAWKQHKLNCGQQPQDVAAALAHSKRLRHLARQGIPVMTISMTAFGLVVPGLALPSGVPTAFALKQTAAACLQEGPPRNSKRLGNLKHEVAYRDYYLELQKNTAEWMTFFDHPGNSQHAEHTCGILGTLATIYRHRGDLIQCEQVLDLEEKVMDVFKRNCDPENYPQLRCCDSLHYRMDVIRMNLLYQTARYREGIPVYRRLLMHECQYEYDFEAQEYLFMVECILGLPPNRQSLDALTDEQVLQIIMAPVQHGTLGYLQKHRQRVALETCAACGKKEPALRTFKICSACKTTFYCGKTCQQDDWKVHKKTCQAVKK